MRPDRTKDSAEGIGGMKPKGTQMTLATPVVQSDEHNGPYGGFASAALAPHAANADVSIPFHSLGGFR